MDYINPSLITDMSNMFFYSGMNNFPIWYNNRNIQNLTKVIRIKKNILNSKNNTCNTKLYDFILKENIHNSQNIKFIFAKVRRIELFFV